MKTYCQLIIVLFLFVSKIAYGDIGPSGPSSGSTQHYVTLCTKITNLNEYPEISLLVYVKSFAGFSFHSYEVSSDQCLTKDYKFDRLSLYAVKKEYLIGKNISTIDLPNDKNASKSSIELDSSVDPSTFDGYYVPNSNPLITQESFYKIIGYTDSTVVLFKWKVVSKFNHGQADLIFIIPNSDLTTLSQTLPANQSTSGIELFPNPAQKSAHIKITNTYNGYLYIGIFSVDGKKVNSAYIRKDDSTLDYDISVASLSKGTYLVYLRIGDKIVSKKLIVN